MDTDRKTFCSAPWFQIRNDNKGRFLPCCVIRPELSEFQQTQHLSWPANTPEEWINGDYAVYLRQQLASGRALPECHRCWDQETSGQKSIRQQINDTVSDNRWSQGDPNWMDVYFQRKYDWQTDLTVSADIKINNLCNYACVMCNPADSTQIYAAWRSQQHHPAIKLRIGETDILDQARNMSNLPERLSLLQRVIDMGVRHLKILGGEPLMDQRMLELLMSQSNDKKNRIYLIFITNGSQDLVTIKKKLENYRGVAFVVSLEGIDEVQDYIRKGGQWSKIQDNLLRYLDQFGDRDLFINHTVQALTVLYLPALRSWCQQIGVNLALAKLIEPEYLSLASVPPTMRDRVRMCLGDAADMLDQQPYQSQLLHDLWQYLDWYDPDQRWRDVLPDWAGVLDTISQR